MNNCGSISVFISATLVSLALLNFSNSAFAQTTLPNGYRLTPVGSSVSLPGDFPVRFLFSDDSKKLLVETSGFHDQNIDVVDVPSLTVSQSVDLSKDWQGMAFTADHSAIIVASGRVADDKERKFLKANKATSDEMKSFDRSLVRIGWDGSKLATPENIQIPTLDNSKHFVGGMAVDSSGNIYTLNIEDNTLLKLSGSPLSIVASAKVGYRPYAIALSPNGKEIAVSNWGDQSVSLITAEDMQPDRIITVGSHPNDLAYGTDGRLFVANSGSNTVSVIKDGLVVETIATSLTPNALVGSTPDALAISPDGKRLYVANADNNDVAVVDISNDESKVLGFIPTGWYPSAISVSHDGKTIAVGTAKGMKSRPNYPAIGTPDNQRDDPTGTVKREYIADTLSGDVSLIPVPDKKQLETYSKLVWNNTPYTRKSAKLASDGLKVLKSGKIKHVVFIIRENRTYDQVFGDIAKGNGDPTLAMFGKTVTPNAHKLADHYVLFDNLYCNGEVSEDGHQWCDAAYATDFTEKSWVNNYSGRDEIDADERLTASPAGYIWDNCAKHKRSYYSYGEMADFTSNQSSPPVFKGESSLAGHASEAVSQFQWGKDHDTKRAEVLINDLHQAEKTGVWPAFTVMWLGEDHTQGLKAKAFTPQAMVAANDLALGQIVDAVSHSSFWKSTAIFIIEDDAQNGPDHVDSHRTAGLLISPFTKRNFVDSTTYSTASYVRTMEMALGLPPMTQFDAGAAPLVNALTGDADFTPYDAVPAQIDIDARNPATGAGAAASSKLDLDKPDEADPDALNRILWAAYHPDKPIPAPVRRFQAY